MFSLHVSVASEQYTTGVTTAMVVLVDDGSWRLMSDQPTVGIINLEEP